ncbi:MAG: flagellar hook-length control protein FliK [Lachnospira sp.]|nr:flagellar hook-length control protein FliK [Lachnospira sp.]MBO5278843.1 flagellar hook-length control protein FliK [Lachnospiraceae bacterium]
MTIANIQGITAASKSLATGVKKTEGVSSFSSVMSETSYQKSYTKSYGADNHPAASVAETTAGRNDTASNTQTNQGGQTAEKADRVNNDSQRTAKDSAKASRQDNDTVEVEDVSEATDKPVDEEVQDIVATVADEIRSIVQEALGISDEDMAALMGELNLTDKDLLNPDNVLKLVMEQNGLKSTMDILNNEELASMVKDLMKNVETVKAEMLPEQLTTLMESTSEETVLVNQTQEADVDMVQQTEISEDDKMQPIKVNVEGDGSAAKQQNAGAHTAQQNFQHAGGELHEQPVITNGQTVFEGLTQAVANTQTLSYSSGTQALDIVTQLVNEIRAVVKAETQSMEVQLNPESLGKVNIQVVAREGILTAHIAAQTEAARSAIESQIVTLKESFQNQGLKVEAVEVTVGMQNFNMDQQKSFEEQQQNFNKARKQLRLDDVDLEEEGLSEEESIAIDMMRRDGNQVDFSA